MGRYDGQTAIVTGGASGIGRALAQQLVAGGATVLIADIAGAAAAAQGLGCEGTVLDVTDAAAVRQTVQDFAARHGRLDYIFNNAGVVVIGESRDMDDDDWFRVLDVNIRGVVHGTRAAYALMAEHGHGHIVNTASAAGLIPAPGAVPYATSKHAVVGLSRSLRAEAQAYGVRVSAICPGFIRTPLADNGKMLGITREQALGFIGRWIGWMTPEALAAAALKGVRRNQAIIVAPASARALERTARHAPTLADALATRMMGQMRKFG